MFHQQGEFGTFLGALRTQPCWARAWGKEGDCCERTFHPPFCAAHCQDILHLEIKSSPVAGRGLFASRMFLPGDVIVPYMGDVFRSLTAMYMEQQRRASPYAVMLPNGSIVDASLTRGMAAHINAPTRDSGNVSNVRFSFATLRLKRDGRHFLPADSATGLCIRRHRSLRLRHWKRIHHRLLAAMDGQPYPLIVATKRIEAGEELFMAYRNPVVCRIQHNTHWDQAECTHQLGNFPKATGSGT